MRTNRFSRRTNTVNRLSKIDMSGVDYCFLLSFLAQKMSIYDRKDAPYSTSFLVVYFTRFQCDSGPASGSKVPLAPLCRASSQPIVWGRPGFFSWALLLKSSRQQRGRGRGNRFYRFSRSNRQPLSYLSYPLNLSPPPQTPAAANYSKNQKWRLRLAALTAEEKFLSKIS